MIRTLLATTALATLVTTGAFAQTAPAPAPAETAPMTQDAGQMATVDGYLASNLIGENVYNGTGDDAQNIGDVNDLVVSNDGSIQSVIVGVGGFLGIGEKDVAVDFKGLTWTERNGDRWLVTTQTKEQLEAQPAFDKTPYEPAAVAAADGSTTAPAATADQTAQTAAPAATADQTAPAATADQTAPAATADQTAQTTAPADPAAPAATQDSTTTAAIDRSTLSEMPAAEITAENMVGTTVYGADDANVGEIGDIVLTQDGKIDAYVIDVGGFLGMGEKQVAVGSDNLAFMTDKDGNRYLYTNFTKEQLEAQQAYDESTYTAQRDQQRLMMTQ